MEALGADWSAGSHFTSFCEESGDQVLQHPRPTWCLPLHLCGWTSGLYLLCFVVPAVAERRPLLG